MFSGRGCCCIGSGGAALGFSELPSTTFYQPLQFRIKMCSINKGAVMRPGGVGEEDIELISRFREMFIASHEIEYLENAVGLAKELSRKHEWALPYLDDLLQMQQQYDEGLKGPKQSNFDYFIDNPPEPVGELNFGVQLDKADQKSLNIMQGFLEQFKSTKEVDHINNAIGMAEVLALKDRNLQPLLDHMVRIRDAHIRGDKSEYISIGTIVQGDSILSHDDKRAIKSKISMEIKADSLESVQRIESLMDAFKTTDKIEHLDNAIEVAEDLALKDKGILPLLEYMSGARDSYVQGGNKEFLTLAGAVKPLPCYKPSDEKVQRKLRKAVSISTASVESVKVINELLKRFNMAQEIEYLTSAIEVAEDCVKREKYLQPLLDSMLEVRDAHAKGDKSKSISLSGDFLGSDKIDSDSLQINEPGISTMISGASLESLEVIQSFLDTFHTLREIEYFDEAFKLAEDLALKDEGVIPMLECMSRLRDAHLKGEYIGYLRVTNKGRIPDPEWSEDNALVGNQGQTAEPSIWNPDTAEMIKQFRNTFKETGDIQYLDSAIEVVEELITSATSDSRLIYSRSLLHSLLEDRHKSAGVSENLRMVIESLEEAMAAIPLGHPDRLQKSIDLGERYGISYEHSGAPEDLHHAITWTEAAITIEAPDHPGAAELYISLSQHLQNRYQRLGDLLDLEQAIKILKRALMETPLNHPGRVGRVECLMFAGKCLVDRYERTGALEDLEQARGWFEESLAVIPQDDPRRPVSLIALSKALYERYERFQRIEDIQQAIKWTEEALELSPQNHPSRAMLCSGMAGFLLERFSRFGNPDDLHRATKWGEETLIRTPLDDDSRAVRCSNQGVVLSRKYRCFGALEDLEQAIKWSEAVVVATPPNHPARANMCSNLGAIFHERYARSNNLDDLQQAIRFEEEAVSRIARDNPRRFDLYSNLSEYCIMRYKVLGESEDLDHAFQLTQETLAALSPDHPSRQKPLWNMGQILHCRHRISGVPEDLDQAIKYSEDFVGVIPVGSPGRAGSLIFASTMIASRFEQTSTTEDFHHLLQLYYEAWHSQMSPPKYRIDAATRAARLLMSKKRWTECVSLLADAVRMLPKLGSRLLGREDQEYHLSQFTRLAAITASVALQAGEEGSYCLRLLEFGRGVIMGHAIDCRGDILDLHLQYPELSKKFDTLRLQVDSSLDRMEVKDGHSSQREQRRQQEAIHRLDETLTLIRNLPGFEGFQLPPRSEDLMAMASEGPIVTFNSTELRSDAIIVTRHSIKSLPLPKMIYSSVKERMSQIPQFVHGKRKTYRWRNNRMGELLLWLWDVAVEPVLEVLKVCEPVDGVGLPRVWWVGVGLLAMAPFHAAGDHSPGSTRNTISQVISSYTPSIKALSYARNKRLSPFRGTSRLLFANMPTTLGHRPLANATLEVENVMETVEGKIHTTRLDHPSAAEVLARLPSCHIIHFTCHGLSDGSKPSKSHLLLQSSSGDAVDKLIVEQISKLSVKKSQIAYLSACSTAENVSDSLPDESIHIASGFQLAGFSHVLATRWTSNDRACQIVASSFYSTLFSSAPHGEGETYEDHKVVSTAFHHAVNGLRKKYPSQPILWAPFIHNGA